MMEHSPPPGAKGQQHTQQQFQSSASRINSVHGMHIEHIDNTLPCLHVLLPGPDGAALRLVLLAELVSAAGFQRDRLYVEWQLHFDPELWVLQHSEQEVVQPGLIQVCRVMACSSPALLLSSEHSSSRGSRCRLV
jgi:hypothetical protein